MSEHGAADLAQVRARMEAARAELRQVLAEGRAELEAARAEPLLSTEEQRELQAAAERGEMGERMRGFAREVDRGEADWESFVRGRDGRRQLLEELVQRAVDDRGEELVRLAAESGPPDDVDVDDPRRR